MILLTGGTGRLGRALRRARPAGLVAPPRADLDLRRPDTFAGALARHRPSIVVHAGAFTDVDGAERDRAGAFAVNAVGTGHLAALCAARAIPLVVVSTDHVFDGRGGAPYAPSDPVAPVNAYGASKAEGERRARAAGGRCAIVRTSWLYGPDGDDFLGAMRRRAGPLSVAADALGHPTPVDGLARWLLALCDAASSGPWTTWHAAGTPAATRRAWVRAGVPGATIRPVLDRHFRSAAARPRDARLDTRAADAAFGPIRWQEALP